MLTVTTFLWREPHGAHNKLYLYGPEHVHRMRSMLARHLRTPHELVCITNQPEGLDPEIRTVPLDERLLLPGLRLPKLMVFRPDAGDWLSSRILLLDLDTVIVDDFTPVVARSEPLVLWRNHNFRGGPWPSRYNSSFLLMDAGAVPEVWDTLPAIPAGSRPSWHDDQGWISEIMGPGLPSWKQNEPRDGLWKARDLPSPELPEGCRAVTFNGPRDPSMPEMQKRFPWLEEHWC
jgi:hypothetical protein